MNLSPIKTIDDDAHLEDLCELLRNRGGSLDDPRQQPAALWPREQLDWLAQAGVHRWFEPEVHGGYVWSEADQLRGYVELAAACLTTAFILTQRAGAVRRIAEYASREMLQEAVPALLSGKTFATVAISHLTTSRRHLNRPILLAEPVADGWILSGQAPWVTGAIAADWVVTGATQPDGKQVLLAVPKTLPGLQAAPPEDLLALNASCTGVLEYQDILVERRYLLAGPTDQVLAGAAGARTGGLTTSALALGHATGPISFLEREAEQRPDLGSIAKELHTDQLRLKTELLELASGHEVCAPGDLRANANSLALRAAQAALAAAKGAGYVSGHPSGRWLREAAFFLVWSCPQPVMQANLCQFAGLA
jgi:alkylation response protein AidB-like acyl-CoA dehydrogenase